MPYKKQAFTHQSVSNLESYYGCHAKELRVARGRIDHVKTQTE